MNDQVKLTPEQIAAQTAAADADAAKAADKAEKAAAKAANKVAKDAAKAEAKAVKEQEKAAKVAEKAPMQNDVRAPRADSICGRIWAVCSQLSQTEQRVVTIAEVMVVTKAEEINEATTRTQYAAWRKFHGVKSVPAAVAAPASVAAPAETSAAPVEEEAPAEQ